jgi:hypothetical protein
MGALPKMAVRNTNAPLQCKVPNLIKDAIATPKRQQNTNPGAVVWEPSRKTARNHRIAFLKTERGTLEPF